MTPDRRNGFSSEEQSPVKRVASTKKEMVPI